MAVILQLGFLIITDFNICIFFNFTIFFKMLLGRSKQSIADSRTSEDRAKDLIERKGGN